MIEISATGRGKNRQRSIDAARRKMVDGELYLIRRHGAWFRDGAHGYTDELAQAGIFPGHEARPYLDVECLSVVPLRSVLVDLRERITTVSCELASLKAMVALGS